MTNSQSAPHGNPCGLNGVEFAEYTGGQNQFFQNLFTKWGLKPIGQNTKKKLSLFREHKVNFFISENENGFAKDFAKSHGPSICSVGFIVHSAHEAFKVAVERGAKPCLDESRTFSYPAIYGIGGSLIYFIDEEIRNKLYSEDVSVSKDDENPENFGFGHIDHFTNNVPVGEMDKWANFYIKIFGFYDIHYFDIKGSKTGLISRALRSPCGRFAIPINEPTDSKSQIQEYLDEYKGSGIQHLALTTKNILQTVEKLKSQNVEFLTPPPPTYYKMLPDRVKNISEDVSSLQKNAILADGDDNGYLLQIFSKNIIGPIFFELIQREGHGGFGEGNFQALFDAIERDQQERGYL